MIEPGRISLGILAGGQGSRLGGKDKARLPYRGSTLLERIGAAFPQAFVDRMLSYNLPPGAHTHGWRCVPDLHHGHPGPMAGMEALLDACRSEWLLTWPIDCRDVPAGAFESLRAANPLVACVISDADGLQPLMGLWNVARLRPAIAEAMATDDRAMHALCRRLGVQVLDIAPLRLGNLNTPQDFSGA
ncbi:molybdenum cofactor guanylyltransferase [Arenimonas sp.]|uniref:molybdenum cofactor guanylyltransferase n=1 Tax=Arenimonas sp. TaxID=1872635 RepID=UPI0039E3D1E9